MKNKMRLEKSDIIKISIIVIVIIFCLVMFITSGIPKDIGAESKYSCDVKSFNLNTAIEVSKDGDQLYTIKGDIVKLIEDPLTMYDAKGTKIADAGDNYHIINQDSHTLTSSSGESYEVVGDFNFFGDSYQVYQDGKLIATAEFNMWNTYGTLCDVDGNLIADYCSRYCFNDYIIQIKESSISDKMILMIFASYYSDQHADN